MKERSMSKSIHSFHIPVMGTAFTIESPAKVARYGISSVISCVDDTLVERMRRFYCKMMGEECAPIKKTDPDARANRITAYLNLMDRVVKDQFERLKESAFEIGSEITRYFDLLADNSPLKEMYRHMLDTASSAERERAQDELRRRIQPGSIDINIMTKLDRRPLDKNGEPMPQEYSDAMTALRGFARSTLSSGVVFSAGFNGHLYSYVEKFPEFHADENGFIKKQIIIKVNDFRSALTQGKFFAKKGLWVSEFRIESGLNCGGHAFGQGGTLMGPCLEEFRQKREDLVGSLFEIYNKALSQKGKRAFDSPHPLRITAQGGIGTAREHNFLINYYGLDATGWGTPFLLVPEATTVDEVTLAKLARATSDDLCLSDVSPLGIPFNNLRSSTSEETKQERIRAGKPGSPCRRGFLVSNTEFTKTPICTASQRYQDLKIEELRSRNLTPEEYQKAYDDIVVKACLCNDLGGAAVIANSLDDDEESFQPPAPAICPGPNLAYFSRVVSLKEMVDHIYGRQNVLSDIPRPHMFIAELRMTIDYLGGEIRQSLQAMNDQRIKYFREFQANMQNGISYYRSLIPKISEETQEFRERMLQDLKHCQEELETLATRYQWMTR